jgi:hypothetical protein
MTRMLLAAGVAALLVGGATVALADDMGMTPYRYSQPYGPNWGAPNSPYYGPTTQSSPPVGTMSAAPAPFYEGRSAYIENQPPYGSNWGQPYGPNWGAPNSPYYGPTTQSSPPAGPSAAPTPFYQ